MESGKLDRAKIIRRLKVAIVLTVGVLVATLVLTFSYSKTRASLGIPFGGPIVYVTPCTCSANFAIKIFDVAVPPMAQLPLIYQPGMSILYPFGMILRPGAWTLGLWAPGGTCLIWVGKACVPIPTQGTIIMVGTSM